MAESRRLSTEAKILASAQAAVLVFDGLRHAMRFRELELGLLLTLLPFGLIGLVIPLLSVFGVLFRQSWTFGWTRLACLVQIGCAIVSVAWLGQSLAPLWICSTILWLVSAGAAFSPGLHEAEVKNQAGQPLRWLFAFAVLALLAPYLAGLGQFEILPARIGGECPDLAFDERQEWGQRTFGPYLPAVEKWLSKAPAVVRDAGEVTAIAPIGAPNLVELGWSGAGYASMRIEVTGLRANGILLAPRVEVTIDGDVTSLGSPAYWIAKGQSTELDAKGRDLAELLAEDARRREAKAQALFDLFKRKLYHEYLQSLRNTSQDRLPLPDRPAGRKRLRELRELACSAHIALGNEKKASACYAELGKRVYATVFEEDGDRLFEDLGKESVYEYLKLSLQLDPKNELGQRYMRMYREQTKGE